LEDDVLLCSITRLNPKPWISHTEEAMEMNFLGTKSDGITTDMNHWSTCEPSVHKFREVTK